MFMRRLRARVGGTFERVHVGDFVGSRGMLVRLLVAMDEVAVLGAARVLHEEHVAARRALKKQPDDGEQRTTVPNHCGTADDVARAQHGRTPSMTESAPTSNTRRGAPKSVTLPGYTPRPRSIARMTRARSGTLLRFGHASFFFLSAVSR